MNDPFSLPSDIEFSLVHFHLEFQDRFYLKLAELLGLRRDLLLAAGQTLGDRKNERFRSLFDPPLPDDPLALRRFQRPSPPFAILPHTACDREFDAGDQLELTVSFWGRGIYAVCDFARVLQSLGKIGFNRGLGTFELAAIEAEDASGHRVTIWRENELFHPLTPPVNEVGWWLDRVSVPTAVVLEFLSPARLISHGRPLFKLDFRRLFPFLLRRVTSMFYSHCGREVVDDPGRLLELANEVSIVQSALNWEDWRTFEGVGHVQDLGGIVGSLHLEGDALQGVFWILRVCSLMNVGKGAAFGAGCFRLHDANSC